MSDMDIDGQVGLYLDLAASMRKAIDVDKGIRDEIADRIKGAGFDESILWVEWVNEIISDKDSYQAVKKDPSRAYGKWIDERIAAPYRISDRLINDARRRMGDDALRFGMNTWDQEIAWAHRMRRSADPHVVVLCHMFLLAARKDVVKEFAALSRVYVLAQNDMKYLMASEHGYTPEEIRFGYGSDEFGPLFLRHARATLSSKVDDIPPASLDALVTRIRGQEEEEVQRLARERAVLTLSRNRMGRMPGVIKVAIELELDSDWLHHAETHFLDALREGKVRLPSNAALPYSEFIDWLRVQKFKKPSPPEGPVDNAVAIMDVVKGKTKAWLASLPEDYHQMGGEDRQNYQIWMGPLARNERPAPIDLVMDYGFFLVELAMSRRGRL